MASCRFFSRYVIFRLYGYVDNPLLGNHPLIWLVYIVFALCPHIVKFRPPLIGMWTGRLHIYCVAAGWPGFDAKFARVKPELDQGYSGSRVGRECLSLSPQCAQLNSTQLN